MGERRWNDYVRQGWVNNAGHVRGTSRPTIPEPLFTKLKTEPSDIERFPTNRSLRPLPIPITPHGVPATSFEPCARPARPSRSLPTAEERLRDPGVRANQDPDHNIEEWPDCESPVIEGRRLTMHVLTSIDPSRLPPSTLLTRRPRPWACGSMPVQGPRQTRQMARHISSSIWPSRYNQS